MESSTDFYHRAGKAIGRQLPPGAKFLVGGDGCKNNAPHLTALVEGLCRQGIDVVRLGDLPAPMVYYALRRLAADGCAMVSVSSDAPDGLQWMLGDRPSTSPLPLGEGIHENREPTAPRRLDVSFDYVASLQETFVESLAAQQRVIVDARHGVWAGKARRYLHAVFPQCLFSTIHDEKKENAAESDSIEELCEEVYRQRAHLGAALHGDGRRISLVDGDGVLLGPEETAFLMLECHGIDLREQRFVYDIGLSDQVAERARQLGAKPIRERGDCNAIWNRVCETDAALGVSADGLVFHHDWGGAPDALYTICRLIAFLNRQSRTLAELRRGSPTVYMTPVFRVPVAVELREGVMERLQAAWSGFPQDSTDGLRIDIPGGWALVRGDARTPVLSFRFEGLDRYALEEIVRRFCRALPDECGKTLWAAYQAAM